jgi:hypothetical protein
MALPGRTSLGQLDDNELAASTMAVVDRVRPHASLILLAIAVLFAVLAGMVLVRSQQTAERTASWEALLGAFADGEPGRIGEVAVRYRGMPAGWWAELVMADDALAEGNRLLTVDRTQAQARLAAAAELYTSVNAQRPTSLVAERGIFGLAQTRESQGQLDEARRGYQALVSDYPSSPFRAVAEARIAALERPATEQWYKWFESSAVVPSTPPTEPGSDEPAKSTAKPAQPADEPATEPGAERSAEPAVEQPAEPVADEPPAAGKPATESPAG